MICKRFKKTISVSLKYLDDTLNSALTVAHEITNEVAKVINNPLFQLLLSQLPDGVNKDAILAKIEEVLTISGNVTACTNLTGIDKVNCLMQGLNLMPKNERNDVLRRLSVALTSLLDGKRFDAVVYDSAVQLNYLNEVIATGRPLKIGDGDFTAKVVDKPAVAVAVQTLQVAHATPVNAVPQEAAQTASGLTTSEIVKTPDSILTEKPYEPNADSFNGGERKSYI